MASVAYLDLAGFRALTIMPGEDVDALELRYPGWIAAQLLQESAWLDSRLTKRYASPFASPYPTALLGWLTKLVTVRAYFKRGVDPLDAQYATAKEDADSVKTETLEAANSDIALFELPVKANNDASGVVKGGPFGYSEQSPYAWTDRQVEIGRNEDANGRGSGD